jgi:IclR family acetate operon transcriptional repressor
MRKKSTDGVAVVEKALDILECLADGEPRSVAQLSEASGASKAAAYRILRAFERRGFAVTYEKVRRYSLGPGLLAYVDAARRSDRLLAIARPVMRELWDHSGETVNLGVRSRGQVLYLEVMESRRGLRATGQVGALDQLHSTALGKAMLSLLPQTDLADVINAADLRPRTAHTVTDRRGLVRAIQRAAEEGHAIDDEENEVGMRCVAAPIPNPDGWPLGAISISGPASRMTPEAVAELAPRLKASCTAIAAELARALAPPAARRKTGER